MKPSTAGSLGFVIGVLLAAAGTMLLYARGVLVPPGATAPPGPPAPAEPDQELAAELGRLRGDVDDLRARLRGGPLPDPERRTYGLSQAELRALAERCELRWDMPPLPDGGPVRISDHDARALGLTDEQRGAADAVFAKHHEQLTQAVRGLYRAARPGADAAALDVAAAIADLTDRAGLGDRQRAVQRVARERAGLAAPPGDPAGPPIERLYRLLVLAGDAVEEEIGGAIGADLARRLRDLHGGFGATWHHAYGCP